jgi:hypothetical protein
MSDTELVRYVAAAKASGATEEAVTATFVLLWLHEDRMRNRVRLRLPPHLRHHDETVAEWVLERVTRSALKLPLEGGPRSASG